MKPIKTQVRNLPKYFSVPIGSGKRAVPWPCMCRLESPHANNEIEGEGIFPIQVHSGACYFYYGNCYFYFSYLPVDCTSRANI